MTIDAMLRTLTLEEKAALLQGKTNWTTRDIPRLRIPSMTLADGPHGIRKQAGKGDHLGIGQSVPATCFPTAATMANSWDPELGERLGQALGQEAAAQDVHVVLGPGLNLKRSPLGGRSFEYFSEDPYLSGKMAAAYIRGIQENGVAACPKHFAANSQELARMTTDSVVDDRTLHELYLTGFEIAVKEGRPRALMTSYNPINGTYANEHKVLLTDVLRRKWGFEGFVVTDWGGSNDHAEGVRAGSCLEMPGPGAHSALSLIAAVRSGKLRESALNDRLRELLPVIMDTTAAAAGAPKVFDRQAHHALARECAAQSIVLLKNNGILPLDTERKIALIGEQAEKPRYQGSGSSQVHPTQLSSLKDALEAAGVPISVYCKGYHGVTPSRALEAEATAAAAEADVVLLCIGLDEGSEFEGCDRDRLELPKSHQGLMESLCTVNPNVILVLSGGAPFLLPQVPYAAAIHGYLGGQAGGEAMADALTGKVNPSGKLAQTWPVSLGDSPAYGYYPGRGSAQYREGLFVGYRYYDTAQVPVLFPFGHGLSYTSFAYSDLHADKHTVSFTLTNTGDVAGSEVAQVYIGCRSHAIARPAKELKGFGKFYLEPGESKRVTIRLDSTAFRYYNTITKQFEVETANYDIFVGSSICHIRLQTTLRIFGTEAPIPPAPPECYRTGQIQNVSDEDFSALLGRPLLQEVPSKTVTPLTTVGQLSKAKSPVARMLGRRAIRAVAKAAVEGRPSTEASFVCHMPLRAMAQMTGGLVTRQMVDDLVYLCNGHFFRGTGRLIAHFFKGRKESVAFERFLDNA